MVMHSAACLGCIPPSTLTRELPGWIHSILTFIFLSMWDNLEILFISEALRPWSQLGYQDNKQQPQPGQPCWIHTLLPCFCLLFLCPV